MSTSLIRLTRDAASRSPAWANVFATLAFVALACPAATPAAEADTPSLPTTPWPLTDGLGRTAPLAGDGSNVPAPRSDRFVGIFYFLWHNNRHGARPDNGEPFNVASILARDPDALKHPQSPLWGPMGVYHYWAEPLHGYYRGDDPWVLRRHAALLADAGIDTLIFDTTNAATYPDIYNILLDIFASIRRAGGRTPAVAFMVNTEAGKTARALYDDLYKPGRHRDLWFIWQGKPLLICDPAEADAEVKAFFTLRRAHWPFTMVNTRNAWHWEATYPQPYGYTDDPKVPEQVNVSVAQNLRIRDGQVTNMSDGNARGRSFHDRARDRSPDAVLQGHNAREQWTRARELDPPFVMVTGWNEWIAGRFPGPNGRTVKFVDQFDQEHSRDIEPMKGGHLDHYYGQLVAEVRRFKGVPPVPRARGTRAIDVAGPFSQWADVQPVYTDDPDDAHPRDHDGAAKTHYVNRTGRNDLARMKVSHDADAVTFYVQTRDPITPAPTAAGLWLLIDTDRNPRTGWEGYDAIVNRTIDPDGTAWIETNAGGWSWTKTARVALRVANNELHVRIPREALRQLGGPALTLDFKWVDNLQKPGDVMDFYTSGDVAPESRFKFRYDAH
ncbi:MAG: hypothetical protein U0794_03610 [Isosphaeraceae bacterium]